MNKLKPNHERIDFITTQDINYLCTEFILKFGKDAFNDVASWSLSNAYRIGIERGLEVAKEVDVYVDDRVENER